jgi:hypothetical protein
LLCRNKSISDGVNRSKTCEVLRFVGGEGAWLDAEDFGEFVIEPFLDQLNKLGFWRQFGVAS